MSSVSLISQKMVDAIQVTISNKVKESLGDIPAEMYQPLIDTALDEYLNGPYLNRHQRVEKYNHERQAYDISFVPRPFPVNHFDNKTPYNVFDDTNTLPGQLKAEIQKQLAPVVVKEVQNLLGFSYMMNDYGTAVSVRGFTSNPQQVNIAGNVSQALEQLISDNAPKLVNALFAKLIEQMLFTGIQNFRST